MYSKDEQKFIELRAKLETELLHVVDEIQRLTERYRQLEALLNGDAVSEEQQFETENPVPDMSKEHQQAWDDANLVNIVSFLKENPGWSRAELQEGWASPTLEISDLKRLLEKGKRRGVIRNEGRGRASVWYAVKK